MGNLCTTPQRLSPAKAVLSADITVVNETGKNIKVKVTGTLMYRNKVIGKITRKISFVHLKEVIVNQVFDVPNPKLWDVDNPNLYTLVTEVKGRELLDNANHNSWFQGFKI